MTLSQIQVELRLHCDSDEVPTTRRSLTAESLELGTDNYGSNKWILADTIVYDERRSFVNLIVTDINDNSPIFMGKENEPIYVGYPIPELEETVHPRALTELKVLKNIITYISIYYKNIIKMGNMHCCLSL